MGRLKDLKNKTNKIGCVSFSKWQKMSIIYISVQNTSQYMVSHEFIYIFKNIYVNAIYVRQLVVILWRDTFY